MILYASLYLTTLKHHYTEFEISETSTLPNKVGVIMMTVDHGWVEVYISPIYINISWGYMYKLDVYISPKN